VVGEHLLATVGDHSEADPHSETVEAMGFFLAMHFVYPVLCFVLVLLYF
jgi:hypothetical protein